MWKISQSEFEEILGMATVQADSKIVRVHTVPGGNVVKFVNYPVIPTRKKSRALQLPVSLLWSKKINGLSYMYVCYPKKVQQCN